MDKTYFLEVDGEFENEKLSFEFTKPFKGTDIDSYSRTVIKHLLDLFAYYGVDKNRHIDKVRPHYKNGDGNSRIIQLDVMVNEGLTSKSHIRRKIGVLQKVQATPVFCSRKRTNCNT